MSTLVQCSICLEQFTGELNEDIHATKCGHIFHNSCIVPWIKRSKNCPECRVALTTRSIFKLYLMCEKQSTRKENSSAVEKRIAVETRFLEESNKKLLKENATLKIQLGEVTSQSWTMKDQLAEAKSESTAVKMQLEDVKSQSRAMKKQLDEKDKIIKQLKADSKKANVQVKYNTTIDYDYDDPDVYYDEYMSTPKTKRAKSNWSNDFVTSPPAVGYAEISNPIAKTVQHQLRTGQQKMMNARAEIRFDYPFPNNWW